MTKMSPAEAFVETLLAQGVEQVFGILGTGFLPAMDLFDLAGIRFVTVVHEQTAAHMADGYARSSGKHGVVAVQNGPGVTNLVTGIATAYSESNHLLTVRDATLQILATSPVVSTSFSNGFMPDLSPSKQTGVALDCQPSANRSA